MGNPYQSRATESNKLRAKGRKMAAAGVGEKYGYEKPYTHNVTGPEGGPAHNTDGPRVSPGAASRAGGVVPKGGNTERGGGDSQSKRGNFPIHMKDGAGSGSGRLEKSKKY